MYKNFPGWVSNAEEPVKPYNMSSIFAGKKPFQWLKLFFTRFQQTKMQGLFTGRFSLGMELINLCSPPSRQSSS